MRKNSGKRTAALEILVWQALKTCSLEELGKFVFDDNRLVRETSAAQLHLKGGDYAFKLACEALKSRKIRDQEVGVLILSQLDTPRFAYRNRSIPLIRAVLHATRSKSLKRDALIALGHLKDDSTLGDILAFAQDESADIRVAVAAALISFPDHPKAKKAVEALKHDASDEVRYWAGD